RGGSSERTSGHPVAQATFTAVPRTNDPFFTIASARSNVQGLFDLAGVPPGSYQVFVTRYGEGLTGLNALVSVDVADKDIENFSIVAAPEFKLPGRFVMEGGSRSYPRIASAVRDPEVVGMSRGGFSFNPPAAADGSFVLD